MRAKQSEKKKKKPPQITVREQSCFFLSKSTCHAMCGLFHHWGCITNVARLSFLR